MQALEQTEVRRRGSSTGLIAILHGWQDRPHGMRHLAEEAGDSLPDYDLYMPRLPLQNFFSRARVADVAKALLDDLDRVARECPRPGGYESIILVGHSLGAALVRSVWATAHGAQPDASVLDGARRSWASRIDRLVLLAGVNRGWDPNVPVNVQNRLKMWLADVIENVSDARFAMLDIRRGAPFLTTMRLQVLQVHRFLTQRDERAPVTVHILGMYDNVVAPTDNFDLATKSATEFYLEVPDTGHQAVLELQQPARRRAFRLALIGNERQLKEAALDEHEIADLVHESRHRNDATGVAWPGQSRPTDLVFVVHGIRDYGYWTRRLAIRVKRAARARGLQFETITASYGFFPMGPFLLPAERRKRVGWLMDQYVTARARCGPDTRFHFIGHSNGTYLLAKALKVCPAVKFDRVVFAGSVVNRRYDWQRLRKSGQVGRVLNYVGSDDLVVASLPAGLQAYGADIGDAGHHGFQDQDGVTQVRFVRGGHSGAVAPQRWPEMVGFLVQRTDPAAASGEAAPGLAAEQTAAAQIVERTSGLLPPLGLMLGFGIGAALLLPLRTPVKIGWALGFFLYVRVLSRVITRL